MQLQDIFGKQPEPWGIRGSRYPWWRQNRWTLATEMQRAIARQAEAERERRAKVIHAGGEDQAAEKLAEAANILSVYPAAILRFLQTLTEVATEKNSTTIFPLPIDLLTAFLQKKEKE